ncbi:MULTISPECIES: pyridoxamine 5'-phosphate oxidase family protein [unclassified Arthrobacter]|uniref:pyridoxamine 5'-phosphate oxidase family protein n=1 Tax=unclassified Arthrobacter TaxID=235627 RepID=UPI001E4EBF9F|nr:MULTISPECIES: pyridoxamine 5'-phosphate oxidase family protein [unclassified Arthrobacter]MCC9144682.1 pyridoxamine 5'-phosphate oxidase family protein [Arthrobacter sp. zg-Y919]MDK1275908.1 pyridoxamine 5'-phosphate oxidase family protein [Arthrobacter sp. zg.Y919]MDM7990233.1 pyridoxamine 5'-phosphate oxidase family protein [Arthrobacter sp. zg-Y877]WIB02736.1 pyridoxamine 5'-phosphate oxidase family protein [Arthrobacter sp. zg-Y919]
MLTSDESTPDHLTSSQCWNYIRQARFARLAVVVDGHPEIFPINFAVDHGTVVFRTAAGTKLAGALSGSPVAFEIDGYDDTLSSAWSVVLKGGATLLEDYAEVMDSEELPLFPWQSGTKNAFVRIEPEVTAGRRFLISNAARRNVLRGMGLYTE